MLDTNNNPQHHIQRFILDVLRHTEHARFRDLRPPKVDSNAFSYHLTQLTRQGFIAKSELGYTLTFQGIAYLDRVSRLDVRPRLQPKIMTITAIYNQHGEVLVFKKKTQPMINQMTLPAGMLHLEDHTIRAAALREVYEKLGITLHDAEHAGDCYMAVRHKGVTIMNALMHVFVAHIPADSVVLQDTARWCDVAKLASVAAPATKNLLVAIASCPSGERFFEEYSVDW